VRTFDKPKTPGSLRKTGSVTSKLTSVSAETGDSVSAIANGKEKLKENRKKIFSVTRGLTVDFFSPVVVSFAVDVCWLNARQ
jgi:hypothetical protein